MATPTTKSNPGRALLVQLLILVALGGWMLWSGVNTPRLGLDLQGGTTVTLQPKAAPGEPGAITQESIDQAVTIIQNRVNAFGVAESEVAAQGSGENAVIVVSVPGVTSSELVELVGQTARLTFRPVRQIAAGIPSPEAGQQEGNDRQSLQERFDAHDCSAPGVQEEAAQTPAEDPMIACDEAGATKFLLDPVAIDGQEITDASAGLQEGQIGWVVQLSFDSEGARKFATTTQELVGQPPPQNQFAIVLDGGVVSAPSVNEPILGGQAQITGNFGQSEATDLSTVLKYGALPLTFEIGERQTISPTLGTDQLQAGLIAGGIGMVLVVVYLLIYYRALALVAVFSLVVAAAFTYGMVVFLGDQLGFTLTLAGVAGLILAIGITADSFIVYFERIRDEVRDGRSLRVSLESGWTLARHTIIVADFVAIIASVILYTLSVGGVRGFAFTLGLTTVIDLIVVFLFTKPMVTVLARTKFFVSGSKWTGLSPERLGAPGARPPLRARKPALSGEG